jgi:hypothetical protein
MKHLTRVWLTGAILSGLLFTLAAAQNDNLADYARKVKQERQAQPAPKKVYDNENMPRTDHLSVVGPQVPEVPESIAEGSAESGEPTTQEAADQSAPAAEAEQKSDDNAGKEPRATTPGESIEARQKVHSDWQKKIADQKQAVDLAQRELDVAQREYKLRAAAVYADVGYRLRNSAQWDKEDRQYKEQIDAKQKALDAAKQKLSELQDQARKAGLPSKMRE